MSPSYYIGGFLVGVVLALAALIAGEFLLAGVLILAALWHITGGLG